MKHLTRFKNTADALACPGLVTPLVASIVGNGLILASKEKYGDEIIIKLKGGKYVPESKSEPEPSYPGLKFKSTGNSAISLTNYGSNTPDMKYSLDGGETWTLWDYSSISLTDKQWICFKGNNTNGFSSSSSKYSYFVMTGSLTASGNIMSLIDDGACETLVISYNYCYYRMFWNCSSLTSAPTLPATTLAGACYLYMFLNCSSLTNAPALPTTTLANYCYLYMFYNCSSLTSAPALPATTLALSCYSNMFRGCSGLTNAPALPATTLANNCYLGMFLNCSRLTSAPALPATTLANSCYSNMFNGCSSLTSAPALPTTTLADNCYFLMFFNCFKLNYIECLATFGINTNNSTTNWVNNVASSGAFIKDPSATWPSGTSGIPSGWYTEADVVEYNPTETFTPAGYVTFTAQQQDVWFSLAKKSTNQTMYVSKNGTNWMVMLVKQPIMLNNNETIYVCGNLTANNTTSDYTQFGIIGKISASGNCNALWNYTNLNADLKEYCGYSMFSGCSGLTSAPTTLPATTLATRCYYNMFSGCSSLTSAPELPATTLALSCYYLMFFGCSSLTSAPALPATTLALSCYYLMFFGCSSLTSAPALPATTLADYCYLSMFSGCSSLISAPELPATTLTTYCYHSMFSGCSSLISAPALPATTLTLSCYYLMFRGCSSLTTTPELPATTLTLSCYSLMFSDCSSLTSAPELPATTLVDYCYSNMFLGCSSLTSAPELPATTLANYCYSLMFYNCSSLTGAPALPATTLVSGCYLNMFYNCSSLTSAPILPATTLVNYCYSYMFRDCTNITSISLNNNLTTIPGYCMQDMLTGSITIPNSVTSIDSNAFYSGESDSNISSITGLVVNGITYKRNGTETLTVTLANGTSVTLYFWTQKMCFLPDTLITLADGSTKQVKDLTYDDQLKVWNFDEGHYDTAPICWLTRSGLHNNHYYRLTFSDGTTLCTTGQNSNHKVYNVDDRFFEGVAYIEIGKHVFTENSIVTVTNKEYIEEEVEYYNVITSHHFNCFANGVLTSDRYGNMYEIDENMVFIKEPRPIRPYSEFEAVGIKEYWYQPLRLYEQKDSLESINNYIHKIESQMLPLPTTNE